MSAFQTHSPKMQLPCRRFRKTWKTGLWASVFKLLVMFLQIIKFSMLLFKTLLLVICYDRCILLICRMRNTAGEKWQTQWELYPLLGSDIPAGSTETGKEKQAHCTGYTDTTISHSITCLISCWSPIVLAKQLWCIKAWNPPLNVSCGIWQDISSR